MQTKQSDRYGGSTSNAYSPNLTRPPRRGNPGRVALKVALCVVLPPVGLVWIWRTGSFAMRGRVLSSVLAFASMLVISLQFFQTPQAQPVLPQPAAPVAVTHAPEEDVVTALSNMEELLLQQEAAEAAALGDGEAAPVQATEAPVLTDEEIYETVVYSVYNNAQYYHVGPTCEDQTNRRELTVRQALSLGLSACPVCNPPTPSQ